MRLQLAALFSAACALLALACAPGRQEASHEEMAENTGEAVASPVQVEPLDPPAGPGALAPRLTKVAGSVWLSWLEPVATSGDGEGGHRLLAAELKDGGERAGWSEAEEIQRGTDFFANWADVPGVVEASGGRLFAHALRKLGESTYAYGARLSRSPGDGTWRDLGLLHDDDSATEHGFVSYVEEGDEAVRAFWLDGRAMLDGGGMHLRTARLRDDGAEASELLDERVCECCSTDAAMTSGGPIVAYRDRSDGEIRDVHVIRAEGDGWSEPVLVHEDGWHIYGCPVNGPALSADGERVALAWFTAAGERAQVKLAFSEDGGASFAAPILVDGPATGENPPLGRVDVELVGADAYVAWLGTNGDRGEIRYRRVSSDGELGAPMIVAETSQARSAGVPQMTRLGDKLLFAWIEEATSEGESARLRAGVVKQLDAGE